MIPISSFNNPCKVPAGFQHNQFQNLISLQYSRSRRQVRLDWQHDLSMLTYLFFQKVAKFVSVNHQYTATLLKLVQVSETVCASSKTCQRFPLKYFCVTTDQASTLPDSSWFSGTSLISSSFWYSGTSYVPSSQSKLQSINQEQFNLILQEESCQHAYRGNHLQFSLQIYIFFSYLSVS